ncbi:ribose 5-phosphate isomerase B [Anaerotalea alkaliphila]|uniref:Ribose 5-phosphate isomerase B n=1 Tax=Anaerotalea alkaliphila TaxID=2662126 RepID=A0A7X5HW00_9FIRM|nr:ribose 5-phosphate isomerase B [Anaerotalea alkaliphila]NDL67685.1 ribose 5-phosphate isomerase B [Anaerotalea alkaliphila]
MKIAIGCDDAAIALKETIKILLVELGHEVEDYGVYTPEPSLYPDTAVKVCEGVLAGDQERGILICGTGIGMAIAANKVPGIRAAVCHDLFSTQRSIRSNDCQIMTLGERVIGPELAKELVKVWLECDFAGGGSAAKVEKIMEYEQKFIRGGK